MLLLLCTLASGAAATGTATPPTVPLSFVASTWINCSSLWPMCPSTGGFTEMNAQDGPGFRFAQGPFSFLPKEENQLLVVRFDLGYEYLLWVDATAETPKVINCTRGPADVPSNQTAWEHGYYGNLEKLATLRLPYEQCTSAEQPQCQVWEYNSSFGSSCGGSSYTGHEEQRWLLAPMGPPGVVTPATVFSLSDFRNDIHYPEMPKGCTSSGLHSFWHETWSNVGTSPPASLFDVPTDCNEVADAETLRQSFKGRPRFGRL
jgi:hypothetical protein